MTAEELQEAQKEIEKELEKQENKLEEEARKFWEEFKAEYNFEAELAEIGDGYMFRDKELTRKIYIREKVTDESMIEYNVALERFGSGPSYDDRWNGISYPILDNKVLPITMGGGTLLLNQFKDGDSWIGASNEKHDREMARVKKIEDWLETKPKVGSRHCWRERY